MKKIDTDSFVDQGYIVRKGIFAKSEIDSLLLKFHSILNGQLEYLGIPISPLSNSAALHANLLALFKVDIDRYKNVLKAFYHLPMLHGMGASNSVLGLLNDIEIDEPSIAVRPVVHVIAPDLKIPNGYHLTPPHQDWTFVQGSIDSVTIWIPLMDVPIDHHPLQVWPGSHKRGLLDYRAFECGQEVLPVNGLKDPTFVERGYHDAFQYAADFEHLREWSPDAETVEATLAHKLK